MRDVSAREALAIRALVKAGYEAGAAIQVVREVERAPVPCTCGQLGTHRAEPGIGCTTPGCLCLEPEEHR